MRNDVVGLHRMLGRDWFLLSSESEQRVLANVFSLLDRGEGDTPYCMKTAFNAHLTLAQSGVVLGRPLVDVVAHLEEAVSWGLQLLACQDRGRPLVGGEVELEVGESGVVREVGRRPMPAAPAGPRPLSVAKYQEILHCAVAFGTAGQRREVASYPEARYHSADVIVAPSWFRDVEAQKAYILDGPVRASRLMTEALARETERSARPGMETWLALCQRDWPAFERHLHDFLRVYKKEKARQPGDPAGVMSTLGMALGRLAIEAWYVPAERPYLPFSLLPNWPTETASRATPDRA